MRIRLLVLLFFLSLSSIGWADEYVLVMSKDYNLCTHMRQLYNDDLKKYGHIKYKSHREFNWIRWEKKEINLRLAGTPEQCENCTMDIDAKVAIFDLNNDSKDEVVINSEGSLSNSPTDDYIIFRYDDLEMLDDVVDGKIYYSKQLKGISSAEGVPLNIYEISEENIKKLPQKMRDVIDAAKKRGDKIINFVDAGNRINFLKLNNHFYITFDEYSNAECLANAFDRYHREGERSGKESLRYDKWLKEGFNDLEKYSVITEYQKDNTLKTQCLYFKKDKPAKRRIR